MYEGGSASQRGTDECGVSFEESGEERTAVEQESRAYISRDAHMTSTMSPAVRPREREDRRQEQVEAVRSDDSKR